MLLLLWSDADELVGFQIFAYLKSIFSEFVSLPTLQAIMTVLSIEDKDVGWQSLCDLMSREYCQHSKWILELALMLCRNEATSHSPDLTASAFYEFAKLEAFESGAISDRSRRGEDSLGTFAMQAFNSSDPELHAIAHQFFELAFYCVAPLGSKAVEAFLVDFYDSALLKNTDSTIQRRFFESSEGSLAAVALSQLLLQRKFGLGSGLSLKNSPLDAHLDLVKGVTKMTKSKCNLSRQADRLELSAFYCAIKPFFSPSLSSFALSDGKRIPWIPLSSLEKIREAFGTKKTDKTWNPYLIPYRLLFSKAEIDVIVISSSSENATETATPTCKRVKTTPIEID